MTAAAILPERRDYKFHLPPEKIHDWNGAGVHWTQFLNTLSVFFPAGERFFIDSVRCFRDQIKDPELSKAIKAFIGQEAMHTREHVEYNDAMAAGHLPAEKLDAQVAALLDAVKKYVPKEGQLAATIALEHLTAVLADMLLKDPRFLANSDERYAALWMWHAVEETEHKGVAFDVYENVMGKGPGAYALRVGAFVVANAIFWSLFYPYYFAMVKGSNKHLDVRGWWKSFRYQWGNPGGLRRIVPDWLDYFRPGFHPWDHDNRHFLERVKSLQRSVASFQPAT